MLITTTVSYFDKDQNRLGANIETYSSNVEMEKIKRSIYRNAVLNSHYAILVITNEGEMIHNETIDLSSAIYDPVKT